MFQLGSALLDACVLAVVSKEDTYGYLLTQEIRTIIEISESTLYPVLRRLQTEEMLVVYDRAFSGRNRRYYQITPRGREHLEFLQNNWQHFKAAVDYLLITMPAASSVEVSVEASAQADAETDAEIGIEAITEASIEVSVQESDEVTSEEVQSNGGEQDTKGEEL